MYTIKQMSELSGVTSRTLRYYDEIGLLIPNHLTESGYRMYGKAEINKLQEILFYKHLEFSLLVIKEILNGSYDRKEILKKQKQQLKSKILNLQNVLQTLENSIEEMEGEIGMTDEQKFEVFKNNKINENETKYGKELREKYGNDTINDANKKYKGLTKEQFEKCEEIEKQLNKKIVEAFKLGDTKSELAMEMCELHKQWLMFYWNKYNAAAHLALTKMYVEDERFTKHYDDIQIGSAQFIYDSMCNFIKL